MCVCMFSQFNCVQLFVTLWTIARQIPFSMRFSRQEYWSELSFPPSGDYPNLGTVPLSPVSPESLVDSLLTESPGNLPSTGKKEILCQKFIKLYFNTRCYTWHRKNMMPKLCLSSIYEIIKILIRVEILQKQKRLNMELQRLGKTEQWKSFSCTKKAETLLFQPILSFQE